MLFSLMLFIFVFEANAQTGSISGVKFNDVNGDGIRDIATEPGLPNWRINYQRTSPDSTLGSVYTNVNGEYSISSLPDGDYIVSEVQQPGWTQTAPASGTYHFIISSGIGGDNKDFGNQGMGSIRGMKYHDLNHSETKDPGEPGLSGWTISLEVGSETRTATTDASGFYTFSNVPVGGTYQLSEIPQTDWEQTEPASPYSITVISGTPITDKNFGNFYTIGNISGYKFLDLEVDVHQDSGYVFGPLNGWTINLTLNNSPYATTTTKTDGKYIFTDLPDGDYVVSEEIPDGWVQTAPTGGVYNITISPIARTFLRRDFSNRGDGTISGIKFYDRNGNGFRDLPNDNVLPNWGITLQFLDLLPQVSRTIYTDQNGHYQFSNLPPGSYRVSEIPNSNWQQTCPVGGDYPNVILTALQPSVAGLDFGNRLPPASISGKKLLLETSEKLKIKLVLQRQKQNIYKIMITQQLKSC